MTNPPNNPCPICGNSAAEAFEKAGFEILVCGTCQHMFCEAARQVDYVSQVYGDAYFDGGGGGYTDYVQHREILVAQGKKYAQLLSRHVERGKLLDVGAAAGFLLQGFEKGGWQGTGIEPNASMVRIGQENGLAIIHGSLESVNELGCYDAVAMIQVISHLRDPVTGLKKVYQHLRPGGVVLVETWDRKSWTAKLLGKNWHQYNPPSVLHWYTRNQMQTHLEASGFRLLDLGRPTKWISIGNGVSLLRHSLRESVWGRIVSAPLGLIPKGLQVPYFLDDVFWMIAQKPEPTAQK